MTLNFKQLEAFVWAADLGSFSKAATRLNTTQPNISIRIRALENALNAQLLDRDAGSVRLTARGQSMLPHARDVLFAADKLVVASGESALREGTLRLGVTELIVHTWLQGFLKSLNEHYPNIQVELTIDLSTNLTKELFNRNIDLALQNGPFERESSGHDYLGTYPLTWVASPDLGLPKRKKLSTAELTRHAILTHARESSLFKATAEHFQQVQSQHHRLVPSSNLAACLYMAINHMGVATLPKAMIRSELDRQSVVELNYSWTPESLDFIARYDAKKSPPYIIQMAALAKQASAEFGYGLKRVASKRA